MSCSGAVCCDPRGTRKHTAQACLSAHLRPGHTYNVSKSLALISRLLSLFRSLPREFVLGDFAVALYDWGLSLVQA